MTTHVQYVKTYVLLSQRKDVESITLGELVSSIGFVMTFQRSAQWVLSANIMLGIKFFTIFGHRPLSLRGQWSNTVSWPSPAHSVFGSK